MVLTFDFSHVEMSTLREVNGQFCHMRHGRHHLLGKESTLPDSPTPAFHAASSPGAGGRDSVLPYIYPANTNIHQVIAVSNATSANLSHSLALLIFPLVFSNLFSMAKQSYNKWLRFCESTGTFLSHNLQIIPLASKFSMLQSEIVRLTNSARLLPGSARFFLLVEQLGWVGL